MEQNLEVLILHPQAPNPMSAHAGSCITPEQPPLASSLALQYRKLKEMDQLLDSVHKTLSDTRQLYQQTLSDFAIQCRELWQQEKAQGSRDGKGFRKGLENAGIKVGRAYRALRKFFPADFPSQRKPLKKKHMATSFAAIEVRSAAAPMSGLYQRLGTPLPVPALQGDVSEANQADDFPGFRFTSNPLLPADGKNDPREILECTFAVTPQEKAEFMESLKRVHPAQVQHLFLQALKQAAKVAAMNATQSEIPNKDAVCSGVSLAGAISSGTAFFDDPMTRRPGEPIAEILNKDAICSTVPLDAAPAAAASNQKSEIENQKSIDLDIAAERAFHRLTHLRRRLYLQGHCPPLDFVARMYAPADIHAALDWVDAHPEWSRQWRYKSATEFLVAFQNGPIDPNRRY